jgi:signal transduction histidine kinase
MERAGTGRLNITEVNVDVDTVLDMLLAGGQGQRGWECIARADGADHPVAMADPLRFRQIVRNLITNAIRYGGEEIEIQTDLRGDTVLVRVIDNGLGIAPEEVERVFAPYTSGSGARRHPSAVGLGLTVSRQLAQLMDGDVVYRREEDRSVFELELPALEADVPG